jgi:hypothetical protein
MAQTYQLDVSPDDITSASATFFTNYGYAMAQWSRVERGFFWWFAGLTALPGPMARAIFFGIRGFGARLEVLESVIDATAKLKDFERDFIDEAFKKARQFAGFRNAIAHGEPRLFLNDPPTPPEYRLIKPKLADSTEAASSAISNTDLQNAALNFRKLGQAIFYMHPRNRRRFATTPREYLAQVAGLPAQANFQSDQIAEESEPPDSEPVLRNKKAYRASQAAKPK